jgi:hypothetical protein
MEEWSFFLGNGLPYQDKALLHMAPLHILKTAYNEGHLGALLYDGAFQPLHGRSSPNNKQTYDHCIWRSTHTESLNAVPMVCKLTQAQYLMN